ncbi:MAG: helix-turn-helix domain-containing protein [Burkholderiales bacterium]|nr:helix-turn-helix domain-containing protein [Burkholderiales bacterium]
MPNLAVQLKSEISRLSRREIRNETKQLKKSSAQYRSEIATLKRRLASLESALKRLAKGAPAEARPTEKAPEEKLRFRAAGFATLRKKLGLSAEQMGKLVGVSGQSIYHWESGKARPRASQLPSIAAVRNIGKREAAARLAK